MEKWSSIYEKEKIFAALDKISEYQKIGVLCEHVPTTLNRINRVKYDNKVYDIESFIQNKGHQLLLSVTHQCNLRCKYCCYGESIQREGRTHSNQTMSFDIAEKAISSFLGRSEFANAISFYGGEPLLNFPIVKHSILFAKNFASKLDKKPMFLMTTNGTLLTDEIIHYLVQHNVFVHISVDAVKESHDQFRVFKDTNVGSYDTVIRNIDRFIELYPTYRSRGIIITLTSPIQIEKVNEFLIKYSSHFDSITIGEVFEKTKDSDVGVNISAASDCSLHSCLKNFDGQCSDQEPLNNTSDNTNSSHTPVMDRESFSLKEEDWRNIFQEWHTFIQRVMADPIKAREEFPLIHRFLLKPFLEFHNRDLERYNLKSFSYACHCFPGFTRLYCNALGDYYPCERVPEIPFYKLGNVIEGFDYKRSVEIMEAFRRTADCGNCVIKNECNFCPSLFDFSDSSRGNISKSAFEIKCKMKRFSTIDMIKEYTKIMEEQPEVFDNLMYLNDLVDPRVFVVFD
ncbi:MAG: radical SAM protein [Planctomycetaceae bacterium]|nr:radical SAM protein [Planctomycetaceae bacterium]